MHGAIGQCMGQFRTGALTLGPIGSRVAPPQARKVRPLPGRISGVLARKGRQRGDR